MTPGRFSSLFSSFQLKNSKTRKLFQLFAVWVSQLFTIERRHSPSPTGSPPASPGGRPLPAQPALPALPPQEGLSLGSQAPRRRWCAGKRLRPSDKAAAGRAERQRRTLLLVALGGARLSVAQHRAVRGSPRASALPWRAQGRHRGGHHDAGSAPSPPLPSTLFRLGLPRAAAASFVAFHSPPRAGEARVAGAAGRPGSPCAAWAVPGPAAAAWEAQAPGRALTCLFPQSPRGWAGARLRSLQALEQKHPGGVREAGSGGRLEQGPGARALPVGTTPGRTGPGRVRPRGAGLPRRALPGVAPRRSPSWIFMRAPARSSARRRLPPASSFPPAQPSLNAAAGRVEAPALLNRALLCPGWWTSLKMDITAFYDIISP